jgi:hypothetical protein
MALRRTLQTVESDSDTLRGHADFAQDGQTIYDGSARRRRV